MGYRVLDHTADVRLEIEAASREELFAEALVAFSDTISEVNGLGDSMHRVIALEAETLAELFVLWFEELLFVFETECLLFRRAEVSLSETAGSIRLAATARGEVFSLERHPFKMQIKAITYHGLELGRADGGWRARVILDL